MERLLGADLLLVRYTPKDGGAVEARQPGFPRSAVEGAVREGVGAAMQGGQDVSDPVVLETDEGQHSVLVVSVPIGSGAAPVGALTGVVDFAAYWDPVVGGRRSVVPDLRAGQPGPAVRHPGRGGHPEACRPAHVRRGAGLPEGRRTLGPDLGVCPFESTTGRCRTSPPATRRPRAGRSSCSSRRSRRTPR